MSMPSFPPNGADMTREEALTMIIASIAMEELALSHILNAEGEKLQYILGTLPGAKPCASPQDVLAVNKSVAALVEAVTQNQILLQNKLSHVLEFCPLPPSPPCPPAPCPPPCPPPPCPCSPACPCPAPGPSPCPTPRPFPCKEHPCEKSILQLTGQREGGQWSPGCRLTWKQRKRRGTAIRWDDRAPAQICLTPGKSYIVQYTLNVRSASPSEGALLLRQSPCGVFTDTLPLRFSAACGPQSLHTSCVLHPRSCSGGCEVSLSLVLESRSALCVEEAVLDVIEL